MSTHEREIVEPVKLCGPDGQLNPDAVGWSRRPLHQCNLSGHWGRKKRWDYYCVTNAACALQITYASLDYLGLVSVALHDLESKETFETAAIIPMARGFHFHDTVGGGPIHFARRGFRLDVEEQAGGTRLQAAFKTLKPVAVEVDVFLSLPDEHDTLNVVIPWSQSRFQFTSKHNCRPATGTVDVGGRSFELSPSSAFGCLDYGRGKWRYRTTWNWASASGVEGGRTIGLQFGGKWTDGTGMTESGVLVDGKLFKIGKKVDFVYNRRDFDRPWTLRTADKTVDLVFTPMLRKRLLIPFIVASGSVQLCFGHFEGTISVEGEEHVRVRNLLGWAEEMKARW